MASRDLLSAQPNGALFCWNSKGAIVSMPKLNLPSTLKLTAQQETLIREVHHHYATVIVEKEFEGGYSGTRVFLTLPIKSNGASDARVVTKLGPADALRAERDKYEKHVARALPYSVAQVRDFHEQDGQAGLNYVFVGGETLGNSLSLEEYYLTHSAQAVSHTLTALLDKSLGDRWYRASTPWSCLLGEEYGRHLPPPSELEQIAAALFPTLKSKTRDELKIPGLDDTYPDPLQVYPGLLNKMLEGRRSLVHGDLHLRNVIVDEGGKGWLIDFAKVQERHNLFDFIKMETYLRLMVLAAAFGSFSFADYAQFERSLNDVAPGHVAVLPTNASLLKAYEVIVNLRGIAQSCMRDPRNFRGEYLPGLFLYSLAMLKYSQANGPTSSQLIFITACVAAKALRDQPQAVVGQLARPDAAHVHSPFTASSPVAPAAPPNAKESDMADGPSGLGGSPISVGAIINGTGIAIGHGAQVTVTQSMNTASDEIARAFMLITQKIENLPPGPTKEFGRAAVAELKTEALKGEKANEESVRKWFEFLIGMSDDLWEVMVSTFVSPITGLSLVFKKIAERAKEMRAAGKP